MRGGKALKAFIPGGSSAPVLPADKIEALVVDQIRRVGADPELQSETFRQVLAEVAAKAVGKRAIRQGDITAYGSLIPEGRWQVAAINPPYGIWWPISHDAYPYELASDHNVESQHFVLELVTHLLAYNNGLLLGIFSGKFFDNNPRAAAFHRGFMTQWLRLDKLDEVVLG